MEHEFSVKEALQKALTRILVLSVIFGGLFYIGTTITLAPEEPIQAAAENSKAAVTVSISFGDSEPPTLIVIDWMEGQSAFDALVAALDEEGLELAYTDYGGELGAFIESIAGVESTNDRWWQYWINGTYGQIGVSNAQLNPEDRIEFKLTGETL